MCLILQNSRIQDFYELSELLLGGSKQQQRGRCFCFYNWVETRRVPGHSSFTTPATATTTATTSGSTTSSTTTAATDATTTVSTTATMYDYCYYCC